MGKKTLRELYIERHGAKGGEVHDKIAAFYGGKMPRRTAASPSLFGGMVSQAWDLMDFKKGIESLGRTKQRNLMLRAVLIGGKPAVNAVHKSQLWTPTPARERRV